MIAFEVDIERTLGALAELVELTGSATHVPVLSVDGEVFTDFDRDMAASVLELVSREEPSVDEAKRKSA